MTTRLGRSIGRTGITARPVRLGAAVATLVLVSVLAACSGGSDSGTSADTAGGSAGSAATAPKAAEDSAGDSAVSGGADGGRSTDRSAGTGVLTSNRVVPQGRDIVYRGALTVEVRDVAAAAARVESMVLGLGGVVADESSTRSPGHRGLGQADLTVRVPPADFGGTLDRVAALGRELERTRSARDVTAEMTDVDSRVRTQERSVARVRTLLAEADTIGEVVQIESELARREADLESLQAQLARLQDVTDLSTIEVLLVARDVPRAEPVRDDDLGFVAGLRSGWDAFGEIVLVVLTVLGALLPFLVVAGLVGLPAYVLLRRSRRPASSPDTP
jgi:hypothetical protein